LISGYVLTLHDMRALRVLGLALLVAGIITTVLGVLNGDIHVGLALFFIPYMQSSTSLGALAIILIFAGIATLVLDGFYRGGSKAHQVVKEGPEGPGDRPKKEFGGVVLIGPVPIVFGSSDRAALLALIAAAAVVMAMMLVFLLL
jgi:uncharacterized protein (TIGR00304 family)